MDEAPALDLNLVSQLRAMVLDGTAPSDILEFLSMKGLDKQTFVAYMEASCPDDDCDEGMIWLVASRWWTGNQTPFGADRLLGPIFSQARERWRQKLG